MSNPQQVGAVNQTQQNQPTAQTNPNNPVDDAVETISNKLDDSGWFDDVTHEELNEISEVLENLSPADTNEVISRLSDDQLAKFSGEMNSNAPFGLGGLNGNEKNTLFTNLARDLDGEQLARLAVNFTDRGDIERLGTAIAEHASPTAKVDFIEQLANPSAEYLTDDATHRPFTLGASITEHGDPHALAVGEVLASLSNNQGALREAYNHLSDSQLDAVFSAAMDKASYATQGGFTVSFDPEQLVNIIEAAATSSNPELKARVFEAGARQLNAIRDTDSVIVNPLADEDAAPVTEALTALIKSDTVGVVNVLETQDRYGDALVTFNEELIRSGQEDVVGEIIADLQTDNGNTLDPLAYMEQPDRPTGDPHYGNAQNLGYYSGSVQAAIDNITSDAQEQARFIGNIFSTTFSAVGKVGPTPFKIGTAVATGLTREIINAVVSDIKAGHQSMQDAFYELAFPRDPGSNQPYEGAAEPAYDSSSSRVILAHQ